MLRGQLGDPAAALDGQRAAAGILEGRDQVEERGVAGGQLALERLEVEAVIVGRDRDDVGAELPEDLQRPVVGRLLDEHAAARGEPLRQEHEPLQRAVRQEDASRVDVVPRSDPLAQRLIAGRRPVGEDRVPVPLDRGAGAVGELGDREAFGRGDAAGERDRRHDRRLPRRRRSPPGKRL